jgi:hypothetical protein
MSARGAAMLLLAGWAPGLAGCPAPQACPCCHVTLSALAAEHNSNADKVPRLWARARVQVTCTNPQGRTVTLGSASPAAKGNARLMLTKDPDKGVNFLLAGGETGLPDIFRVGADARSGVYYLWFHYREMGSAWFGRTAYSGAPGVRAMPFDASQLLEVLGLTPLPPPAKEVMPAVVMTMSDNPCAYVVQYLKPQPVTGHLKVWREVYFHWADNQPRLPFHLRFYDGDGRCRVKADVANYRAIETDAPAGDWPVMPTDIRVTWPAIKDVQPASALRMTLTEMSTIHPFVERVFDFWTYLPPEVSDRTQVDVLYGTIVPPEPLQP